MNDEDYIYARDEFLALITGGCNPAEAAQAMDIPLRYFRMLRNPSSDEYDEQFAQDYDELMGTPR